MKYDFDCVVIGSGIAGMTASIYLKRAGVKVLLLDNDAPGGLLNKISKVENYPGFTSISGPDLAYQIVEQVKNLGIEMRYGNVLEINNHTVKTDIETITANKIIIATGRMARQLEGTNALKNVSYCAICDGNLYKNKVVAIIGGGNSALEEALYLKDLCSKVFIISRSELKGETNLQERVKEANNIEIKTNCVVNTLNKENNIVTSIDTNQGILKVDGIFISIGYVPNVSFLKEITNEKGYIEVNENMQTQIDYIYACGDIIQKDIYQLTTAVGEGTIAAISVKKQLSNK